VLCSAVLMKQELQSAVKEALDRAVRDNDLVYVSPIPPASQLSQIVGAGMVKLATPKEVVEPVAWLMGGGAGMPALFSGLVPYGVHLALSEWLCGFEFGPRGDC
jgi:programmed cell death 6-interacting protein